VVIRTLTVPGNDLVNLRLEQTGISGEPARNGARYGWGEWTESLKKLLEQ